MTIQDKQIRIYNVYCPPDRNLTLDAMDTPPENSMIFGDTIHDGYFHSRLEMYQR